MKIKAVTANLTDIRADAIIVNHFEGMKQPEGDAAAADKVLDGAISRLIKRKEIKGKPGEITLLHGPASIPAGHIVVVGLGRKRGLTVEKIRGAIAETCRYLRKKGVTSVATGTPGAGIRDIKIEDSVQAVTEGTLLGLYTFRRYITKKDDNSGEIKELTITGRPRAALTGAIERGRVLAEAANWARDMVNEPGNNMTPTHMAEAARQIAEEYGLNIEVLDKDKMAELGMGGLLGVSQGSQQPPKFIILSYKGKTFDEIDIALVGKGITFDSGGISIKPSERMGEMKGDMAGGASVLATLIALARIKPEINVTALVPATENLPSGTALKPGDIIKAMNGKTIEVLNTDAEGRLILADALSYARKLGAKNIIDVATLTGACMVALGDICSGAFSNNQALANKVIAAGNKAGERIWQLPMYDEYKEQLKSNIADIKNIGGRYGGAITAAKFLAEFINGSPWVHLDIAGTYYTDKEKGYIIKGGTGVPVRTLVTLILDMVKK
jgi:leucyl aminopeptidase